jgi:hypothetical protein
MISAATMRARPLAGGEALGEDHRLARVVPGLDV